MFHNIFERLTRKSKNKPIKVKPKIIADIHEKDSSILAELMSNKEIETEIISLKIGDYLIGNTIIERKTISDFISSMINKRLVEQLNQMQQYKQKLLIIEGDLFSILKENNSMHPNAIRGFILSIITNYETNIIFTKDALDTSKYLITLAKQQLKSKTSFSLHSRIPKTLKEQKQYILEAFPNIGPRKSEFLLKKFKTLDNVFNASEEELKDILKNNSKDFKNILKD
jgi:ERCC4-type nuclease